MHVTESTVCGIVLVPKAPMSLMEVASCSGKSAHVKSLDRTAWEQGDLGNGNIINVSRLCFVSSIICWPLRSRC